MKKRDKHLFEDLQDRGFYLSNAHAKARFNGLEDYPDALGFDEESGGYLALHKNHQRGAIADELGACVLLKNKGYRVELLSEEALSGLEPDARINGTLYDIKRLRNSNKPIERLSKLFRRIYSLSIQHMVLHIDQTLNRTDLERLLSTTAQRRSKIKGVILIYKGEVFELSRQQMIDKKWGEP